jgi:SAM-dependent methyltransferase
MKRLLLRMGVCCWWCIPSRVRYLILKTVMNLEARLETREAVKNLLNVEDELENAISWGAMALEAGVHPKHRLTKYHRFFTERIKPGQTVVDIGCGYGAVAYSMAKECKAIVYGIDIEQPKIDQAKRSFSHEGLHFVVGDALEVFPADKCDVCVLSNVLEHIEKRPELLRRILTTLRPKKILIRVPLYERRWTIPYKQELGLSHFGDPTHYAEHTQEGWIAEIETAGLKVVHHQERWGEIWCECEPA